MRIKLFLSYIFLLGLFQVNAQVGIGTINPNTSAKLDVESTTSGMLIPRMTTIQRDSILAPADGLQVYNTTNNTLDLFSNGTWKSLQFSQNPVNTNLVYVYSLADLPTPIGIAITLDATKMYVFSGFVNISPNYIMMNGAGLRGTDPQKDMVVSDVNGAVLRSVDTGVFIENLAVVPHSSNSMAYDFSDATGTKFCNIFAGSSIVEIVPSLGVGQISGFNVITVDKNYWKVSDGIKITGNVKKFVAAYTFVEGITTGSAIEFLSGLDVLDVDLSNNYFVFEGLSGLKVNVGAEIDKGRLTTNMFRGVANPLSGIDSYSRGWSMKQNTDIPDSRAFSYVFFNDNVTSTSLPTASEFYKIAGSTTVVNQKRFIATDNKLTYNDVEPLVGKISVVIGAKAPSTNSDFSIAIAKNGTIITAPVASMAAASNNQAFQITLHTEVDLVLGDYIEVFIRRNNLGIQPIVVSELQFKVTN